MLKGPDLVADTAFLTLRRKMGYQERLLGIVRRDCYEFQIESGEPPVTVARLKRFLNTQTLFYNRNKHHFRLRCRWEGGTLEEGAPGERSERSLSSRVRRTLSQEASDFHGGRAEGQGILTGNPVFRTEVLVEDLDASVKAAVARKLESELAAAPVDVPMLGVCWDLALRARDAEHARSITEEIVMARKRDRGLLANPNYQGYRVLGIQRLETLQAGPA